MILILGGTSDSLEIACLLYEGTPKIILSTATEYGYQVYRNQFGGEILYGEKDKQDLLQVALECRVKLIIDATHPYASNISKNAIEVSKEAQIEYIRYERPVIYEQNESVIFCDTYEEAGKLAEKSEGNIFITTGSNYIEKLLSEITDKQRVKVRVLPQAKVLSKLERLGLQADNIIAVKGPFSEEMNLLMLKEAEAQVIILKESGSKGGVQEKLHAANQLGLKSIIIKRPSIEYPNIFTDYVALKKHVLKKVLEGERL